LPLIKEPLNQSSAADDGSFAPTPQFEKLEIHKVFLRFPNFDLEQNLTTIILVNCLIAYFCVID
jgi:hypothetical protein